MLLSFRRRNPTRIAKAEKPLLASQILVIGILLVIILAGFRFRLLYAERPYFHPDEYVSMLAAKMVAERGAPILPSGLWYDPEITFSYFGGFWVWLLGASSFAVRWASVFFGVLSIALAYATTARIFSSSFAGVTAAALLAFAPEAVLWGARARRYGMGEFFVLLMLLLVWIGFVEGSKRKYRIFSYLVYLVAGLTVAQTLIVVPPLLLAVVLLTWKREGNRRALKKGVFAEAALVILVSSLLLWKAKFNFVAPYATGFAAERIQEGDASLFSEAVVQVNPFLVPAFDWDASVSRIRGLILLVPLYKVLALPALLAVILSLMGTLHNVKRFRRAIWFLLIIVGGVASEFLFLVSEDWTGPRPRYLFVTLWPAFVMLACGIVAGLEKIIWHLNARANISRDAAWIFLLVKLAPSLVFLAFMLPRTTESLTHGLWDEINYHQAFQFVADKGNAGDKVMTVLTTASYWYLGRADYYARDKDPFVFQKNDSEFVDRWTGARWVSQPKELTEILHNNHVWFVIDASRLWNVYSLAFKQQLLAQMKPVYQTGNVYVMLPKAEAPVIPTQPEVHLEARLAEQVELVGFTLDEEALLAGSPAQLTLFWKALKPMGDYKIFVHLRDHNNQTVAQADHIPSEKLVALPTSIWRVGEVVPDVSYLTAPPDVPPGDYNLLVGMYDPETLERLPVENDRTGENAVILATLQRP